MLLCGTLQARNEPPESIEEGWRLAGRLPWRRLSKVLRHAPKGVKSPRSHLHAVTLDKMAEEDAIRHFCAGRISRYDKSQDRFRNVP
jgi:hypothetical protein